MAVGGYGRRELCPYSDLDVVLVHRSRDEGAVKAVAERVWYPVWDAGVALDHSVRTVREALAVAATDLKAALGLLDARLVAGDAALADELAVQARDQWHKRATSFHAGLRAAVDDRHAAFGDVAFLLEPELKEGRGGLRDVHALRALAGSIDNEVEAAAEVLLRARVELHRRAGRAQDRLALQEQDGVAASLDYADADALMASVAAAGRLIAWHSDDTWRRVPTPVGRARRRQMGADRPLGPGLSLRQGEVVLSTEADIAGDPSLPWRAGAVWASTGASISRDALDHMAASSPGPEGVWPRALRDAVVALFGAGAAAVPVFETLDQKGLVARTLPEWSSVRSRPQRNAYHRFTVDRHLVETAANAAAHLRDVGRPDLLLLGAWLHDIGKGFPGRDHTDVGMELVAEIGARMGFPPEDVDVLVAMVRHHLLLPDVATRRDLDDPATIEAVAGAVGTDEVLGLLAALTVADSEATGPAAWGGWKAGLVDELVARVRMRLAGQQPIEPAATLLDRHADLVVARELAVLVDAPHLVVVAPDRPGLFSRVAGTLALHGLNVREAQAASSEDGMAVESFMVEPAFGREPDWDRVRGDISLALTGRLSVEARLAARIRDYAPLAGRAAAAAPAQPRVLFDNGASNTATVVEVRAPDAIGVLYRITRALADCDLDVRTAKVSTLGHEVVDAFYVRDSTGAKVVDGQHLAEVERAVLAELGR
ncbi:MAG: [protein-PII] uridylyltransferase [Acidimicrobiaceae bacterium]|nr:[protein-PII] uridylyltransferase [Acidimicrobiaceae bacterium]